MCFELEVVFWASPHAGTCAVLDRELLVELGSMLDQCHMRVDIAAWYGSEFHSRVLLILDSIYLRNHRVKLGCLPYV